MERNWLRLVRDQEEEQGLFVSTGIDPDEERMPFMLERTPAQRMLRFCKQIVEATADVTGSYKVNPWFFGSIGHEGFYVLQQVIEFMHQVAPKVPVTVDFKGGDTDNSNKQIVKTWFGQYKADAVTVHPYMGNEAMQPLLECRDKGIIVLAHTSNKGNDEVQHLPVHTGLGMVRLYEAVAKIVRYNWDKNGNCGLVTGATYPEEVALVRQSAGDSLFLLLPGEGEQGGDLEASVKAGKNSRNHGFAVHAGRSVIYKSKGPDFPKDAREEVIRLNNKTREARLEAA